MTNHNKLFLILLFTILFFQACDKKSPVIKVFPTATPTVIPHIEKIVYTYNGSLFMTDTEGKTKEELFADGKSKWYPSVSPDGWYISYWAFSEGNYNLWVADLRNKKNVQITFDNAPIEGDIQNFMINNSASWSGDSKNLIFSRNKDIWKISFEGYNLIALTENRKSIAPQLSMQDILYFTVIENNSTQNIYFKNIDQHQEYKLTNYFMKKAVSLSVSPDGKKIIYSLIDGDSVNIYLYDTDKKTDMPITNDGRSMSPQFSKDGKRIIFVSTISNRFQPDIWIMKADGTDRRRITTDGGVAPSWLYALTAEMPILTPTVNVKSIEKQIIVPTSTPKIINSQKSITHTSDIQKQPENITEMAADIKFDIENENINANSEPLKSAEKTDYKNNTFNSVSSGAVKAVTAVKVIKQNTKNNNVQNKNVITGKNETVTAKPINSSETPKPTFTPVKAVPYNSGSGRSSSTSSW